MTAEGHNKRIITEKVFFSPQKDCPWHQRSYDQGLTGLHDELHLGRPRSISDKEVVKVIHRTLKTIPKDDTH